MDAAFIMKTRLVLAVVSLAAIGLRAAAPARVIVELADGSQLRGSLAPLSLAVDSPALGKLQLDFDRIATLVRDGSGVKITLRNGDHFGGVLSLPQITVRTLVGELNVPLAQLRQLETLDADGVPTSLMASLVWRPRLEQATRQQIPSDGVPRLVTKVTGARFTTDHRGRTNAAVLLTDRQSRLEAQGAAGQKFMSAITVCGWIKIEGAKLQEPACLVGLGSARRAHAALLYGEEEGLIWVSEGGHNNMMNRPLDPSEWTFVAGTRERSALALYINGVLVQTQPADGHGMLGSPDIFVAGHQPQGWGDEAQAPVADPAEPAKQDEGEAPPRAKISLADVRIYSRALSAEEIKRLYEATKE
mgnify:CR=1 FL=1